MPVIIALVVMIASIALGIVAGLNSADDVWGLTVVIALVCGFLVGIIGLMCSSMLTTVLGFLAMVLVPLSYVTTNKSRWGTWT